MILLWMDGAPSQHETFNPKPGSENQGPTKAISTKIPGVQFAEGWEKTANVIDKIAVIRSMKSGEADHFRGIKLVKSGYPPNPAIKYPTWGSVVSMMNGDPNFDLPNYVRCGKPRIATRDIDHGVLGTRYTAFKVDEPGKLPQDVVPSIRRPSCSGAWRSPMRSMPSSRAAAPIRLSKKNARSTTAPSSSPLALA